MANEAQSPAVTTQRHGHVLVVIVNNPPVNALSAAVRYGRLADGKNFDSLDQLRG